MRYQTIICSKIFGKENFKHIKFRQKEILNVKIFEIPPKLFDPLKNYSKHQIFLCEIIQQLFPKNMKVSCQIWKVSSNFNVVCFFERRLAIILPELFAFISGNHYISHSTNSIYKDARVFFLVTQLLIRRKTEMTEMLIINPDNFRQHVASIFGFVRQLVSYVCEKKNLGHFYARYEVELWYVDCSHKYKIN